MLRPRLESRYSDPSRHTVLNHDIHRRKGTSPGRRWSHALHRTRHSQLHRQIRRATVDLLYDRVSKLGGSSPANEERHHGRASRDHAVQKRRHAIMIGRVSITDGKQNLTG